MTGVLKPSKYASKAAQAQFAANTLGEPFLPKKQSRYTDSLSSSSERSEDSEGSGDSDDSDYEDEEPLRLQFTGKNLVPFLAVGLAATGGLAASAAAMIAMPSAVVFLMGGLCVLNSPLMVLKHVHLAQEDSIRTSLNKVRQSKDLLKEEIDFLAISVDDLQQETSAIKDLERNLQDIASKSRVSVDTIVDLVNENENILGEMKRHLREMFVQSMIRVIIRSDRDGDMKFDGNEKHLLALRLQIQLEPYGIKLDMNRFEEMIREDNDISNVLSFCRTLLFEEEDADSVDNDTDDLETFCKTMDGDAEAPMTFQEKAGMITVNDKYSKGSVEVARGGRMTVVPTKSAKELRRMTVLKEVKKRQTVLAARPRG